MYIGEDKSFWICRDGGVFLLEQGDIPSASSDGSWNESSGCMKVWRMGAMGHNRKPAYCLIHYEMAVRARQVFK